MYAEKKLMRGTTRVGCGRIFLFIYAAAYGFNLFTDFLVFIPKIHLAFHNWHRY